ncbi:MAG: sulfatase-like hydrolase/transferase [Planctomycetaceae bacterium]|nr:sulfatase-like hydrolase/transferase [Planctomycetaceae bacterium]
MRPCPAAGPNIVFVYADDWGWGDLACHGHPRIKTPHLDRLAREGTDFHQFVVCNPVCSPSRTAIVTGQYPARHLVHQHFASHEQNVARGMPDWLDPEVTLLPKLLKAAGYRTGHFGKWHLSGNGRGIEAPLPAAYGFDDAAVWTGPGRNVFEGSTVADQAGTAHDRSGAAFQTIAATEHVLRFIRESAGQPFYVNLWMHETHHLVAATDEQKAPYPDVEEPHRTYYSAVTRADAQVGRVLDLLDELRLADDTIVIFSSDNGPENSHPRPQDKLYYSVGETGGLRGRKRSLYLGGVNVPFLVRWPGQVPAGRIDTTSLIAGVDMLPTLLSAVGVALPDGYKSDGANVLAAFRGEPFTRTQPLFWEWRGPNAQLADWPQLAMRDGNYTLLMDFPVERVELYNVAADREQSRNLATVDTERAQTMRTAIRTWQSSLPAEPQTTKPAGLPRPQPSPKPEVDRAAAFARWDRNRDGVLTLEEYTNGLSKKENAAQRFDNFDDNRDGQLSRTEFVGP